VSCSSFSLSTSLREWWSSSTASMASARMRGRPVYQNWRRRPNYSESVVRVAKPGRASAVWRWRLAATHNDRQKEKRKENEIDSYNYPQQQS
jgi:hypothetical protein